MTYASKRTLLAARNGAIGTAVGWGLCRAVGLFVPGFGEGFDWSAIVAALAGSALASVHAEAQRTAAAVAEIVARDVALKAEGAV